MADDAGASIFQGLIDRGLSPVHAATLAGHIQQESGFRPDAVNPREDAHGLIQWRQDRWQALQDFAKAQGASPTDRDVQLDFVLNEMRGAERKAGDRFFAATDLPAASEALQKYIRFGDDSAPTRLANASRYLRDPGAAPPSAMPASAPTTATPSAPLSLGGPIALPSDAAALTQAMPQAAAAMPMMPSPPPNGDQLPAPQQMTLQRPAMPLTSAAKARLLAALTR